MPPKRGILKVNGYRGEAVARSIGAGAVGVYVCGFHWAAFQVLRVSLTIQMHSSLDSFTGIASMALQVNLLG